MAPALRMPSIPAGQSYWPRRYSMASAMEENTTPFAMYRVTPLRVTMTMLVTSSVGATTGATRCRLY